MRRSPDPSPITSRRRDGSRRPAPSPLGGSRDVAASIDTALVCRLIHRQFPLWSGLPLTPLPGGVDNRSFRLGPALTVRLPAGDWYALQVAKEQRWLPWLAPQLPLDVPVPVAQGEPADGYPYAWSVYRWLPGRPAGPDNIADLTDFARVLAHFLRALRAVDSTDGPEPGRHNFFRGGPLEVYATEAREAIASLRGEIDAKAATRVLDRALASEWSSDPVWFHGDVAVGNLLVRDGRLAAVIDFGSSGVGDPACDTVIAWTMLSGPSRDAFRAALQLDDDTWSRGRGWALWKAALGLQAGVDQADEALTDLNRTIVSAVIDDCRP